MRNLVINQVKRAGHNNLVMYFSFNPRPCLKHRFRSDVNEFVMYAKPTFANKAMVCESRSDVCGSTLSAVEKILFNRSQV